MPSATGAGDPRPSGSTASRTRSARATTRRRPVRPTATTRWCTTPPAELSSRPQLELLHQLAHHRHVGPAPRGLPCPVSPVERPVAAELVDELTTADRLVPRQEHGSGPQAAVGDAESSLDPAKVIGGLGEPATGGRMEVEQAPVGGSLRPSGRLRPP